MTARIIAHILIVASASFFSAAYAQSPLTPLLESYRVVFDEKIARTDHEWVLSKIKKINGRWRASDSRWVSGSLVRQTYEIERMSSGQLAEEISALARSLRWDLLYECHSFGCGRSYAWAKEIFDNKLLHGSDKLQHYWVWRDKERWLGAYLVERANQKVYLQYLEMTPDNARQEALLDRWSEQGFAILSDDTGTLDDGLTYQQKIRLTEQWLQGQSSNIAVVGHNQVGSLSQSAQESEALKHAQEVAEGLKQTLPDYTFKTYSFGPLAPRHGLPRRVEVIPLP